MNGLKLDLQSCDDISIDQFFCSFSPFTQHVITHISSRVAILYIITNSLRLTEALQPFSWSVVFFWKISRIIERLLDSRKQSFWWVQKKSRKTTNSHEKKIILVKIRIIKKIVNWITPSTAVMDYSRCFPQFKMAYIFLKYFFQNVSQKAFPNVYSISVKNKTIEWNKTNKNDKHYQIAEKLVFCIPYQSFSVKMLLQITNVWY